MKPSLSDLHSVCAKAQAIIWDMDGVLIDSESYHFLTHRQALAEFGVSMTKDFYIRHGVSTDPRAFYAMAFAKYGKSFDESIYGQVNDRKLMLYGQLQRTNGIMLIQPAVEIAKRLYDKGMRMAVASQVHREEVMHNLRSTGILQYFSVIVAGGDFDLAKKPAPDIYLKAVELLHMTSDGCIAIEDSRNGAEAAVAAHIPCLVVTNSFTKHQTMPKKAMRVTFEQIDASI